MGTGMDPLSAGSIGEKGGVASSVRAEYSLAIEGLSELSPIQVNQLNQYIRDQGISDATVTISAHLGVMGNYAKLLIYGRQGEGRVLLIEATGGSAGQKSEAVSAAIGDLNSLEVKQKTTARTNVEMQYDPAANELNDYQKTQLLYLAQARGFSGDLIVSAQSKRGAFGRNATIQLAGTIQGKSTLLTFSGSSPRSASMAFDQAICSNPE